MNFVYLLMCVFLLLMFLKTFSLYNINIFCLLHCFMSVLYCTNNIVLLFPQIHLRQFHGTRYAAISPDMVNAEELEEQDSDMRSNQDFDDNQWDVYNFKPFLSTLWWMHDWIGQCLWSPETANRFVNYIFILER